MSRPRVRVSGHAVVRFAQRLGISRDMRHEIQGRLNTALKLGVTPGPDLDVEVPLGGGYKAICYPSAWGGWVVATVLSPDFEIERGNHE